MKGKVYLAALCSMLLLAGCSNDANQLRLLPNQMMTVEEDTAALPMNDVALTTCNNMGGMPTTLHNLDGSVVSKCQLPNGKRF
ncbi:MAG: DUF333 domain-containing protein [Enterobacteriaceae bacterium]|jgi:putative hemolysin|nr:DUF333 domain-containing protein [Enterobacteriaceae bacterium]